MDSVDLDKLQRAIRKIGIPQQPDIILELAKEQLKSEPDFTRIEKIIIRDVGIASYVLKVINSPFFGVSRPVDSIHQALIMLGLKQINNLVTEKLLSNILNTKSTPLSRLIWERSRKSAMICSTLASKISLPFQPEKERAYTLGLFHHSGTLLLMRKHPGYMDIYNRSLEENIPLHEIELGEIGIDHRMIGYAMAQAWQLNPDITQSILNQHESRPWLSGATIQDEADALGAILELANGFIHEVDVEPTLLTYLDLPEQQFLEIEDRLLIDLAIDTQGVNRH
ncbi:MAG: HDOD domain-containing protein [Candidatus Thiodiazotropha sp. (ex Lucinoma borealis)]|nr:HDOD domain-containing protein [Candidatus Thiodiazotropha sp. (ex Lucinoma borealis)]